ncbi:DNA-binding protein YbiB [Malikia sp.]|uniref:DNA-binding protein YbiB n=1 Tax=Malikia sp. TaxID=2070706 RepID=UPI0026095D84|nr:DNA-binding protein YbiB [Malikia sp.]MDD2728840.1 DNA-binding protein YbiB [Malikia sp.]
MAISHYLKEIGRGKDGARSLNRAQATDLFGQLLDGSVTELELGAFCLAMRIKGETPEEMAGFLDATAARTAKVPTHGRTAVVLPSYNGARKLPVLTPLLALLLAREGLPVLVHGAATEGRRISSVDVLALLGVAADHSVQPLQPGRVRFMPTGLLCPGLQRLLEVRQVIGLRNSAHSLVKLMNPCDGDALVVGSYTHPEYLLSMGATFELTGQRAMLLRGTEGEPVADPRRLPQMDVFWQGQRRCVQEAQGGSLAKLPDLPAIDAASTAAWIAEVLAGRRAVPAPIARQVEHILQAVQAS